MSTPTTEAARSALAMYVGCIDDNITPSNDLAIVIYNYLKEVHMYSSIGKYIGMNNSIFDSGDLESEYWFGVVIGLGKVNLEIGNPFLYLTEQGRYRVLGFMRSEMKRGIRQVCLNCSHISNMQHGMICGKCHSENVQTMTINRLIDLPGDLNDELAYGELRDFVISIFSGRKREILELLLDYDEYQPGGSNNYMKSIATKLGISAPAVAKHIKNIRFVLKQSKEFQSIISPATRLTDSALVVID